MCNRKGGRGAACIFRTIFNRERRQRISCWQWHAIRPANHKKRRQNSTKAVKSSKRNSGATWTAEKAREVFGLIGYLHAYFCAKRQPRLKAVPLGADDNSLAKQGGANHGHTLATCRRTRL